MLESSGVLFCYCFSPGGRRSRVQIPCRFVHEDDFFLVGNYLRLGELVKATTGFEDQRILLDKFLD